MQENEINKNLKIKIIVITLVAFFITTAGVSYAFFTIDVSGNDTASNITVTAAQLSLTFTDGNIVSVADVYPGWSKAKTFSVTNNTPNATYYDIKMEDVYTTFNHDELVYTLTSTNSGGTKTETIMPNNDGLIKAKILIAGNTTQTYTMTITFKEIGDHQDYNQGVSYKGKIQIVAPYTYTDGSVNDIKLVDRIMLDNTTAYTTNTSSKYVTASTGINYANPSDYAYDSYYIYEDETISLTSSSNKTLGTSFTYDATSGMFTLTGTSSSQTYSASSVGKYTCNTNGTICYEQKLYRIVEVSDSTVTKVDKYISKPNISSWNGLGLYQTSTNTLGNQPTYFFRGHVTNNYASFAGDLWRVVRIAEDGSVRMIRQENYTNAAFNSTRTNKMYVGYMFGTTSDPYTNSNDSNIKKKMEAYYDSKLTSLSSYLADIEFCNDRTESSISGSNIYYGPYDRLVTNKAPVFTCQNETRDLFTMNTSSRGNNKLDKSVGAITQDEVAYAGAVHGKLSKYYLDNNAYWWSSSPYYYTTSYAYVGSSNNKGGYIYHATVTAVSTAYGMRPYIALKADTLVLGGSGTSNDPYIITQ